jgi:hypothetical protein
MAGTRLCILDLRKVAADAADRIELRQCIAPTTRADTLGFVSARALARFLVLAGPVHKKALVPANGFARIYREPNCGGWPRIADFLSATNLVRQARDALPGGFYASFLGTELPREFGTLDSALCEVQTHRSIVDLSRMSSRKDYGLERI